MSELGADTICTNLDDLGGRFDLILASIGGESLARLATMVEPDGTLVILGNSSNQPTTFQDIHDVYLGSPVRLQSFTVCRTFAVNPPSRDLSYLAKLVADGHLDPQDANEIPWKNMLTALARLRDRTVLESWCCLCAKDSHGGADDEVLDGL